MTADGKSLDHMPIHERHQFGISYLPQRSFHISQNDSMGKYDVFTGNKNRIKPAEEKRKGGRLLEEFHITHVKDTRGDALQAVNGGGQKLPDL